MPIMIPMIEPRLRILALYALAFWLVTREPKAPKST